MEESYILAQVRSGNVDIFANIVEQYQMPIQRYLYRLTGEYDTAQDLAQDTFIQAYKSILKTTQNISLKSWLYRIATNNALQMQRRKRLLSFISLGQTGKMDIPDGNRAENTFETIAINETLLKVPREQRICMVLHFVEGFKYREIAETLGISEEAVRKRVARGSEEFRRIFGSRGDV